MDQVGALRMSVEGLEKEVAQLHKAFSRRTLTVIIFGIALLSCIAIVIKVQATNDQRLDENNRRWCPLVSLLTPRPGDAPPATVRGRQISERAAVLAREFHCPTR